MFLRFLLIIILLCKIELSPALMNVRPDLRKGPLSVTEPADSSGQLLPEELGMDSVDVVMGVLLCEPHPGVLIVIAVEADDGGQVG